LFQVEYKTNLQMNNIQDLTTTKRVIAEVLDEFNIQQDEWLSRAKRWANSILDDIGIGTVPTFKSIEFSDYSFQLPCDLKSLLYFTINDTVILPSNSIASMLKSDLNL